MKASFARKGHRESTSGKKPESGERKITAHQWHLLTAADVVERLGSCPSTGLSGSEAQERLAEFGPNQLPDAGRRSLARILWEQLSAMMVVVLMVAAAISLALGHLQDAGVIMAIVVLNTTFGLAQDYRAEKAMRALTQLAAPLVKVRREGQTQPLPAKDLVPGDIILLETGDIVGADCRILEAIHLQANESSLTGESEPVCKTAEALAGEDVTVPDQKNMAWLGSSVVVGRGLAVVTATGMQTELGRIASLLGCAQHEKTPLQRRLDELARRLAIVVFGLAAIIFLLGLVRGESPSLMLLTAVSMAVAAVPEGLPAVVTITLALGAQRMLRRHALIRRLPAAESLGAVTTICSDKTGTLTENRMTVTAILPAAEREGEATALAGESASERKWLLAAGALCNDAAQRSTGPDVRNVYGDPMEVALVMAAEAEGMEKSVLERAFPRVGEIPFDSARRRMTTLHRMDGDMPAVLRDNILKCTNGDHVAFMKGALEKVLECCDSQQMVDQSVLNADSNKHLREAGERMASSGRRVLGLAYRTMKTANTEVIEEDHFVFMGMIGFADPARPEVRAAVESCRSAGIRPVMITGDHPLTAQHVGRELGIGGRVLTGAELEALRPEQWDAAAESTSIYARVLPEHKFHIVRTLQSRGEVVAMTGDGVNDAPALKQADIGVAMGRSGTDVSKQAADMVLLDDNFASIVAAVEEGRAIYDNIRKFVRYVLAGNVGELLVMLIGPLCGLPLPLLPLQILWINLVSDGINGLGLSVELPESDAMRRPPRSPSESIFAGGMVRHIFLVGGTLGALSLGIGLYFWTHHHAAWQTAVFINLALGQAFQTLAARFWRDSFFRRGMFTNPLLTGSVALAVASTLFIVYAPGLQVFFSTHPLSSVELIVVLLLSSTAFWVIEAEKYFLRSKSLAPGA